MTFYRFLSEYIYKFYPNIYEEAIKNVAIRQAKNEPVLFSTAPPDPVMPSDIRSLIDEDIDNFISSWGIDPEAI